MPRIVATRAQHTEHLERRRLVHVERRERSSRLAVAQYARRAHIEEADDVMIRIDVAHVVSKTRLRYVARRHVRASNDNDNDNDSDSDNDNDSDSDSDSDSAGDSDSDNMNQCR